MAIIPTVEQARELREVYDGNPVIDEVEITLRQRGVESPDAAAAKLEMLVAIDPLYRFLTIRECDAVVARFVLVDDLCCPCYTEPPRDPDDPGAYPGPNPDCECECHQ